MRNRSPGERRARLRLLLALVLAVLFHVVAALLWMVVARDEPRRPATASKPIAFRPLNDREWSKNRGPAPPEQPLPPARRAEAPKPEERPQGQVVDVAPGNREESPDAKYLAESANRAQKETRAREQSAFYRNAMPQRTSPTPQSGGGQDEAARLSGNEGIGNDTKPKSAAEGKQGALEVPSVQRRQELAVRMDPRRSGAGPKVTNRSETEPIQGNSSRLNLRPGERGEKTPDPSTGRIGPRGPINLSPSASVLDKIAGAAPNDHLSELEEGEGTFLNTREWKYASFFNRVKQSVGMHWDPGTQLRQRDPSGEIYGGRDRYTVLKVTLDSRGSLQDAEVEKSSGVAFLDQEAIASFRRAQPFPNPPAGLLGPTSTVTFSFGFFLELGSGPRMRLFRGPN